MQNIKLHKDYTRNTQQYQLKIPFELDAVIPNDDSVRLLNMTVEQMDLLPLYQTYKRVHRNHQASPKQLFKIVLYAFMNRIFSSRGIESACRRDINFMYLLEDNPAPDHATIARFISCHLACCWEQLLSGQVNLLKELSEISGRTVFIDGTKIEANAGKYTFVWKRATTKNQQKLFDKISSFTQVCEEQYGIKTVRNDKISYRTLKRLKKQLYRIKEEEGIRFVYGKGHRKTPIQRSIETLEGYINKLKEYTNKLAICGKRNSYAKTDHDATFMRMKEDYMRNGQLKPAYNLQHAVDSEYIVFLSIFPNPTDTNTLIPMLKAMEEHLPFKYREIVADAGYESEENYVFIEKNDQTAFIKPNNYEISKTRKYKQDISRRENMDYHADKDYYICKHGKKLKAVDKRHKKTASGYTRNVTIYECTNCRGCPYKKQCIHGNNSKTPFYKRKKRLYVSRLMEEKRAEDLKRITSPYGIKLRVNRSIQVEGSFADIKADMGFKRYAYRGKENVAAASALVAMAHNVNKLHHKIQNDRTETYLFDLKESA